MSGIQQLLMREYTALTQRGVLPATARYVATLTIARRFNVTRQAAYAELDAMLPHAQPTPSTSRTQEPIS